MNKELSQQSFKDITYGDQQFQQLLEHFKHDLSDAAGHLCLLVGNAKGKKKRALKKIARESDLDVSSVDANNVITQNESDSEQNINRLLEEFNPEEQLLHLKNGSRLSGVYTAHSLSRVKYGTPQEKYFIKKAKEKGGLVVVDIDKPEEVARTIRRSAQSVVNFPPPASGLKKLIWNLKQVSLQGSHLKNDRPE